MFTAFQIFQKIHPKLSACKFILTDFDSAIKYAQEDPFYNNEINQYHIMNGLMFWLEGQLDCAIKILKNVLPYFDYIHIILCKILDEQNQREYSFTLRKQLFMKYPQLQLFEIKETFVFSGK